MRKMERRLILSVFIICTIFSNLVFGVNITVDKTIEYQTIEGFGAHGAKRVWWSSGPFYNQAFLDLVIDDLGLTIIRNEYYPVPDEPGQWPKQVPYLQALKQKAEQSGEPLEFVSTFWSPPSWMKDNGTTCCGGHLLPQYYDDFGFYAASAIQDYNAIGIDLYALSLQNEPAFVEPYNSCVYTPAEYRDMLKVAGPIIKAAFPDIKLFGTENMLAFFGNLENVIIADSAAEQQMDIWACHGYGNDGQTPTPDSFEVQLWTLALGIASPTYKPLWMSETSGYAETWTDSLQLAKSIYAALKYGHMSAWIWWQLSQVGMNQYVLMNDGTPGMRYYVSKNYYRYIRPGAVMVDTNSTDPNVLVTAFNHQANNTLTLVIVNAADSQRTADLSFTGYNIPPEFDMYRTSSTENCINVGTVSSSGSVILLARSVTTLYGTGCPLGDLSDDCTVDYNDLRLFCEQWLDGLEWIDQDMVSYWKFDQGSGTTAYDSVGTNHGAINGAQWTEGKSAYALSFDDAGDYIDCGNDSSLDLTNNFSISVWVNLNQQFGFILNKGNVRGLSSGGAYTLYYSSVAPGAVTFEVRNSSNNGSQWVTISPFEPGSWTHIVGTFSEGLLSIYKDGSFVESKSLNTTTIRTNSGHLGIGANGSGSLSINGKIDDVRIYNWALSPAEVAALGGCSGAGCAELDGIFGVNWLDFAKLAENWLKSHPSL